MIRNVGLCVVCGFGIRLFVLCFFVMLSVKYLLMVIVIDFVSIWVCFVLCEVSSNGCVMLLLMVSVKFVCLFVVVMLWFDWVSLLVSVCWIVVCVNVGDRFMLKL